MTRPRKISPLGGARTARPVVCVCYACKAVFPSIADRIEHKCALTDVLISAGMCPLCFARLKNPWWRRRFGPALVAAHLARGCPQLARAERPVCPPPKTAFPFRCRCGERSNSLRTARRHKKQCNTRRYQSHS